MRNGSNITPKTVQHGSKTLGTTEHRFRVESDVAQSKCHHTVPSNNKDIFKIKEQLITEQVRSTTKHTGQATVTIHQLGG